MKNIYDYLTPEARAHWEVIKNNPSNHGLPIKVILSCLLLATRKDFSPLRPEYVNHTPIDTPRELTATGLKWITPSELERIASTLAPNGRDIIGWNGVIDGILDTPANRTWYNNTSSTTKPAQTEEEKAEFMKKILAEFDEPL